MITFRKMEHTLVGVVDGKPFNLPRTEKTLTALLLLQSTDGTEKDIEELVVNSRSETIAGSNEFLVFNPVTKKYYLHFEAEVSKFAIPESLVQYIEESFDKDIDFMPVIKLWARFLGNPRINTALIDYFNAYINSEYIDYASVAKLVKEGIDNADAVAMCTYPDIAITQEGLLATYKVAEMVTWEYIMEKDEAGDWNKVKNPKYAVIPAVIDPTTGAELEKAYTQMPEFKEEILFTPAICRHGDRFYSGDKIGYIYEVGKIQKLPTKATRNLDNTFGGGGLYIGGLKYIDGYHHPGSTHVLTCFVNPGDILSFQSNGQAIRVDALMPNNVWVEGVKLEGMYHSSDYAVISGERLDDIVVKAVKSGVAVGEEFREMQNEINKDLAGSDEDFKTSGLGGDFDVDKKVGISDKLIDDTLDF